MKASTALQSAMEGKLIREATDIPYHVIAEWKREPNWDLLNRICGLRFDVSELYECVSEIVEGGSGCFTITLAVPITPYRGQTPDEFFFDERKINALRVLKDRYDISQMWMTNSSQKRKIRGEIFADKDYDIEIEK